MDLSPRALKEAQRQSVIQANRMTLAYQQRRISSWADLERLFGIRVLPPYDTQPFSYASFSSFRDFWKHTTQIRLQAQTNVPAEERPRIFINKDTTRFGEVTLFPEQEGCYRAIRDAFFPATPAVAPMLAALQDGFTGSGKTYVAGALIADLIFHKKVLSRPENFFKMHPFIIFTPKGVVEHWKRILYSMGLAKYVDDGKILVFSNGEFLTNFGETFCREEEDPVTGECKLIWKKPLTPILTVLDECHNFIRPGSTRTRKIWALFEAAPQMRTLFMSATPLEKVNDSLTLILGIKNFMFNGTRITRNNFSYFASVIDSQPGKPNREGVKRLRKVLAPYIFSLPYVKPKFRPINQIWLVDFENERHKLIYQTAHQRYIEVCEKSGKNTVWGNFERFVALNNFGKTAEPLRAGSCAARAAANYKAGTFATAIGCRFKETVAEIVFQLTDRYGISRDEISLIWGGKRSYATEQLLTAEEMKTITLDRMSSEPGLLKRVKLTLRFIQDQHEHDEDPEEQAYRHEKLKELKLLGKQSDGARQDEIDKFQSGKSKICIFTLASGGVGLSLDRDKEFLLPREGIFTPCYNGKEFQQALGRLVRRASLADAYQYIAMLRGTVEHTHVAPILDTKLKCIAEITNRNFDITNLLADPDSITVPAVELRSTEEARLDAERDDSDLEALNRPTDTDDDDDDDDIPAVLGTETPA